MSLDGMYSGSHFSVWYFKLMTQIFWTPAAPPLIILAKKKIYIMCRGGRSPCHREADLFCCWCRQTLEPHKCSESSSVKSIWLASDGLARPNYHSITQTYLSCYVLWTYWRIEKWSVSSTSHRSQNTSPCLFTDCNTDWRSQAASRGHKFSNTGDAVTSMRIQIGEKNDSVIDPQTRPSVMQSVEIVKSEK